jgi:uncharacterized SAM-dependent methyltransferase
MFLHDALELVVDPAFRADVLSGLHTRPRAIPARWFYDRAGSELFEAITRLPEYYPTRIETVLLEIMLLTCHGLLAVGVPSSNSERAVRPRRRSSWPQLRPLPMCQSIFRAISCACRQRD